jgi:uncharacterized protein YecE (DUF72 family)
LVAVALYVGASGWQYAHWRGPFYPEGLDPDDELVFYAARFRVVEVNATFYRLPVAETFARWAAKTPAGFILAIKASRYLTHIKRLKDPEEPVERLMGRASRLGPKLGPVLLQLPPTLRCDAARLDATLRAFPVTTRLAVEFRHDSWFVPEVQRLLEARGAALCIADRRERLITPAWRTSDWGYLRFHEGLGSPAPGYRDETLRERVGLVAGTWAKDADVFAFFNNDPGACALRDAGRLAAFAREAGLEPTPTPAPARSGPAERAAQDAGGSRKGGGWEPSTSVKPYSRARSPTASTSPDLPATPGSSASETTARPR